MAVLLTFWKSSDIAVSDMNTTAVNETLDVCWDVGNETLECMRALGADLREALLAGLKANSVTLPLKILVMCVALH